MGRAPCCEKMGLKKGPWSADEDEILISYIQKHGHANWRALPKQAGLLRCGKSCRLRWINYLRPDLKRGNFTSEEEETIIQLHQILGNRWSAIASRLPGRTDNEIKNVWHTHLKKRLKQKHNTDQQHVITEPKCVFNAINQSESADSETSPDHPKLESTEIVSMSTGPQPSSSCDYSSGTDTSITGSESNNFSMIKSENMESSEIIFWSEPEPEPELSVDDYYSMPSNAFYQFQSSTDILDIGYPNYMDDEMDLWYDLFAKAGTDEELPQFGEI